MAGPAAIVDHHPLPATTATEYPHLLKRCSEIEQSKSRGAVRLQSGYVYHYALAMLLGVVALVTWFMVTRGAL